MMRKLLVLLTLSGILTTNLWATNTPTPKPIKDIEAYLATQTTPVTAYDLAAYFNPQSSQGTAHTKATTATTFGTANKFNTGSISGNYSISVAALSSTHFVVAYQDGGNNNRGTAIIGQVSGTTISSYGNENVFNAASTYYCSVAALSSTHFVVAYQDGGNSNRGTAIVGQVSGTTISSYGSENVFNAATTTYISVAALSSTHFVVGYRDGGNGNRGTAIVGQVSGTTISYGSENVFNAASTYIETKGVVAMSSTKVIIVYDDGGDSDKGMTIIGTISGTSISFGTEEQFATKTWYPTAARLGTGLIGPPTGTNTHYIMAYDNQNDNKHGYGRVGDASADLPVELTEFSGEATDKGAVLTWQTASERNNEGFDIERSTDGKNWETIGFVQGQGTTQEAQNYTYTDEAPQAGTNYYRLKQMDFDGQFEYSNVVNITMKASNNGEVRLFPNPVSDELNIVNGEGVATIYNVLGQPVKELIINNSQLIINTSDLPKGQYILRITQQNGNIISKQFVK